MLENAVARRYAQAFFALAQEKNMVDKFEAELKLVVEAINENPELKKVIDHQLVSPAEKIDVMQKLFNEEVSEFTVNLLNVVAEKYRATYIPGIYEEFVAYANKARNMVDAEVRSAVELKDGDIAAINTKLAEITGKSVRLQSVVDSGLVGGVVVRIGDKVMDGSLAGRLTRLKNNLLQTEVK